MKHNELIKVHPKFKRMAKIGASMNDMTIIQFSEKLADDLEFNYRDKGIGEVTSETKFKKFKFNF